MYFYRQEEPPPASLPQKLSPVNLAYLQEVSRLRNLNNYGACLSVRKKWLYELNGYEEFECFSRRSIGRRA